jgi:Uma2 family endonuclease
VKEASAMASISKAGPATTLGEFLARRDIDEKPYLEFIDGRVEAKMSPQSDDCHIQGELRDALMRFALPRRLGLAFTELRCTFGGRSILPDVVFVAWDGLPLDATGRLAGVLAEAPDLHVEVLSPDQSRRDVRDRLAHSLAHGTRLGWFLDPEREVIEVFRPDRAPEVLPADGVLAGEPVLPGFALPVAEVWSWLRPGR